MGEDYSMKTTKVALMLSALLSLVALSSYANGAAEGSGAPSGNAAVPRQRTVTVAFVEGVAYVNDKQVDFGDTLPSKFLVRTEKGARLDIVFDGGNALGIAQNAIVDVDLSNLSPVVRVERGGVTSVLKKLEKIAQGDSFKILTAQAAMGVRGTSFCVWVDTESTYVCACNGEVTTIDAKGSNEETLAAAHHVARLFKATGSDLTVEVAGMLHHTDESIESVASRIGYTIDWNSIDR
jgi:ferric-dicitrate binding protein FerR (iron transport regulator)